jgi:alpha-tubulin suppressor-like RCC1 family protein
VLLSYNDGQTYACGKNDMGQLGTGNTTNQNTFVPVYFLGPPTVIAAGANHTMVFMDGGYLWMSGDNASGQLGNNSTTNVLTNVNIGSSINGYMQSIVMAGGSNHSLFYTTTTPSVMKSCGDNSAGELGIGSQTGSLTPVPVTFSGAVQYLYARGNSSFILTTDGRIYGFGDNSNGQLGDKTTTNLTSPTWIAW